MRGRFQRFSREMADFTALLNLNQGNQNSEEKLELVKMFVEFLESDKHGHKHEMHKRGHGRQGMCGRFGKHGHGRHHGRHGPYGHHGHHHGHHGPHHHGYHGHHHRYYGLHGHNGKFRAHWTIDLTQEDQEDNTQGVVEDDCITSPNDQESAFASNKQEQRGMTNNANCKCSRMRRQGNRSGRWMPCPYKRNNTVTKDNSCQTDEPMNDENTEQPQENLTTMVENITIENSE